MRHGLQQPDVVHRPGPDQLQEVPHPSPPKLDQDRPPREGFGSISPKAWEEIGFQKADFLFFVYKGKAFNKVFFKFSRVVEIRPSPALSSVKFCFDVHA